MRILILSLCIAVNYSTNALPKTGWFEYTTGTKVPNVRGNPILCDIYYAISLPLGTGLCYRAITNHLLRRGLNLFPLSLGIPKLHEGLDVTLEVACDFSISPTRQSSLLLPQQGLQELHEARASPTIRRYLFLSICCSAVGMVATAIFTSWTTSALN